MSEPELAVLMDGLIHVSRADENVHPPLGAALYTPLLLLLVQCRSQKSQFLLWIFQALIILLQMGYTIRYLKCRHYHLLGVHK